MDRSEACDALAARKCLELRYDGFSRVVEVHAVGLSKEGHDVMRAWQVRGGSVSNEPTGWKLFRLGEALSAHITDETSFAPRPNYNSEDPAMKGGIICRV